MSSSGFRRTAAKRKGPCGRSGEKRKNSWDLSSKKECTWFVSFRCASPLSFSFVSGVITWILELSRLQSSSATSATDYPESDYSDDETSTSDVGALSKEIVVLVR